MTPYSVKTSDTDKKKLEALASLRVRFEFEICVYEKNTEAGIC